MIENLKNDFSSWKPLAINLRPREWIARSDISSKCNRGRINFSNTGMACGKGKVFLMKPSAANLFSCWMQPRNVTVFQFFQKHGSSNPFLHIGPLTVCTEHQNTPEGAQPTCFPDEPRRSSVSLEWLHVLASTQCVGCSTAARVGRTHPSHRVHNITDGFFLAVNPQSFEGRRRCE